MTCHIISKTLVNRLGRQECGLHNELKQTLLKHLDVHKVLEGRQACWMMAAIIKQLLRS